MTIRQYRNRRRRQICNAICAIISAVFVIAGLCLCLRVLSLTTADRYDDMRYENGEFIVEGEGLAYDGLIEGEHYDLWVVMRSDEGDKFSPEDWAIIKVVEAE